MLSEYAVSDAFLRDIGIARVSTLDGLIEAPMLFRGRVPLGKPAPKVGVITTTGGGGATVSDRLALEGVSIKSPSETVLDKVRETGLSVTPSPMLDLTLAGAGPEFVKPAIEAVAADPEIDLVLSVTGSSARSAPDRTVPPLVQADTKAKPLVCFMVPDALESLNRIMTHGVPGFRTPEACADAIGAFCRWRRPRVDRLARKPAIAEHVVLDEERSLKLLDAYGVAGAPSAILRPGELANLPFGYPVVAKVLSDQVPHKTDCGGVILNIGSPEELAGAGMQIKASVRAHHPGVEVDSILVSPMIVPLQELLIGYRLDASVGPIVTLAPGGVLVGLYEDKAVRCAPADLATAREMIDEVKGLAPIRGHRGSVKGDLEALAAAIVALSGLASHEPSVLEAEANPVMVLSDKVLAADALVTLANEDPE